MIYWEDESLNDREKIFEYLYHFNPIAAEKTDQLIETKVEHLNEQPQMGTERKGIPGRLLFIPEISMVVSYGLDGADIKIMRVLHMKQQFPQKDE
ncbi:type II toxin-antitoxin system RelE/ParE family toxin [Reinekea marinisedimentorum]|uniref:Addiction module RelE/StbE family toxin n=1 Tax=Reinekea marinisedimentorum TaxID=230495 RepID=A0A4R3IAB7_9GAMM|nr:type II toxin-antitoxin system RelE/ParE family toxin [Reinekea marinisedimentorum]TCS42104.1 addiction module RelE/StbE family toxin [Reinekea marinisedimentorum]